MTDPTARRRGFPRRRPVGGSLAGRQRGAVTAEIAAALPVLVLVIVAGLWAASVGLAQLRCADAAREAARAIARGDSAQDVRDLGERTAPSGATFHIDEVDGVITVDVSAGVPAPPPLGELLAAPTVHATATAVREAP